MSTPTTPFSTSTSPFESIRGTWKGYLLAVGISAGMTLLKLPLAEMLGHESPFVLFPVAVLLAAWLGGLGPGLLATFLTAAAAELFFLDSARSPYLDNRDAQLLLLFVIEALVFCLLIATVQRTKEELWQSKQKAVDILESISDIFFSVDHEWRLTYVNQHAAKAIGRPAEEMIGRTLWELYPELAGTPLAAQYRKVMEERTPVHLETQGVISGGWYETNIYPSEEGLSVYARDISERKRAEAELRRSEERFRWVSESDIVSIAFFDMEGGITGANDAFLEMVGYSREELEAGAIRWDQLTPPEWIDRTRQAVEEANQTGRIEPYEKEYFRKDGSRFWGLFSGALSEDRSEGVAFVVDITERKKMEKALRESEAMLQSVLDQLPVGVIVAETPSGEMFYYNEEARRQLKGRPHLSADHSEYDQYEAYHTDGSPYEPNEIPLARALRGETVQDVEWHYPLPDGTKLVTSVYAGPIRNSQGEIVRAVAAFSDITERKEMEEALRRQADMLELSHDAIVVWRLGGGIEFWNRGAEELYGFTAEEARGRVVHELLQSQLPEPWERIEETLRTKGTWEGELRQTTKSGKEVIASTRKQLVEEADGGPLVLETNRDITERKRYEEGLEQAKEEAEELAQAKTALLANMSHEVRTPLTGLLILAELLSQRLSGKNRETVLKMKRGAEKLSELLDAVLTLSRLEAGKVELKREVLDIAEEARKTAIPFVPLAERKGLSLTAEEEASSPCLAFVDASSLDSVLNNLIGNAIKFTDEGKVTIAIERGTDERVGGEAVMIRVQDTGPGMDPEFLPHVFEEFRQASTGNTRSHGGAGLGLAISKRLVDLMEGVIEVESQRDVGTTFTVILPGAPMEALPVPADEEAPFSRNGERQRVLFMDDNEVILELLPDLLEDMYEIEGASTPEEALDLATSKDFDAFLLDISMGTERTGVDVLRALRQQPDCRTTPIIAVTAYALPGDEARFLKQGFDAYVSKPFKGEELVRCLEETLSKASKQNRHA